MEKGTIQPTKAMSALLEGKKKVAAIWEQADNQVRQVLNLFAEMGPEAQFSIAEQLGIDCRASVARPGQKASRDET